MKNLMITLVMSLMTTVLFGQYIEVPDKRLVYDSITEEHYYRDYGYKRIFVEEITNTPGSELNLYAKHHYTGVVLNLSGIVVAGGGYLLYNEGYDNFGGLTIVAGGVMSLIGFIYTLEAPIHIKRASVLLNDNGVGIKVKL